MALRQKFVYKHQERYVILKSSHKTADKKLDCLYISKICFYHLWFLAFSLANQVFTLLVRLERFWEDGWQNMQKTFTSGKNITVFSGYNPRNGEKSGVTTLGRLATVREIVSFPLRGSFGILVCAIPNGDFSHSCLTCYCSDEGRFRKPKTLGCKTGNLSQRRHFVLLVEHQIVPPTCEETRLL